MFDFWLKVFAVSFGMGVVSGIVMAFQFGTNWSVLAEQTGAIQGPLLGYEAFTAFMLEATFFGVMLLGRDRVSPWFYFFSCCMVSLGTMVSSFWILANNSWMQVPIGHTIVDGKIIPGDWREIVLGPVIWSAGPHAARGVSHHRHVRNGYRRVVRAAEGPPRRGAGDVALGAGVRGDLIVVQLFFGHLTGNYVHAASAGEIRGDRGALEAQQPASEVRFAIPDEARRRNLFAIEMPGSAASRHRHLDLQVIGLYDSAEADRPPVLIPFFAFRLMVGMGLVMLAVSWFGIGCAGAAPRDDALVSLVGVPFPTGFVAVLTGWFTAEVRRQPWVV